MPLDPVGIVVPSVAFTVGPVDEQAAVTTVRHTPMKIDRYRIPAPYAYSPLDNWQPAAALA